MSDERTSRPPAPSARGAGAPAAGPAALSLLGAPLDRLLGTRTAGQLARQGVLTGGGLLRLLPRRYDTWGELTELAGLVDGEQATVQAQVVQASARRTRGGRPPALMEATVTDGASTMDVVLFGAVGLMKHHAEQLAPGTTVLLSGRVGRHRGRRQLAGPRFQVLDDLDAAEREAFMARPVPIYPATDALPSWRVAKAVRTVLDQLEQFGAHEVPEPLPEELRRAHGLVDALTAYRWVHAPEDAEQWRSARRRLRHEEALVLCPSDPTPAAQNGGICRYRAPTAAILR